MESRLFNSHTELLIAYEGAVNSYNSPSYMRCIETLVRNGYITSDHFGPFVYKYCIMGMMRWAYHIYADE